jgi:hypothetical protein
MATFRCLQSGNTVVFTLPHDIASMERHSGYVRLDEDGEPVPQEPEAMRDDVAFVPIIRKRGRPRKVF